MKNTRPHWLPKGSSRVVTLTRDQLNYILPVFTTCRGVKQGTIDGVTLYDGMVSGHRLAFQAFLRRFEYSDLDVRNLVEASQS